MRLLEEQAARFIDLLEEVCDQEGLGNLRRYSGRGMYGRECVGISGEYLNPFTVAILLADRADLFGIDIADIPVPDTDSLGRGIIIYWPQVAWPEGRVERDEEEDEWA